MVDFMISYYAIPGTVLLFSLVFLPVGLFFMIKYFRLRADISRLTTGSSAKELTDKAALDAEQKAHAETKAGLARLYPLIAKVANKPAPTSVDTAMEQLITVYSEDVSYMGALKRAHDGIRIQADTLGYTHWRDVMRQVELAFSNMDQHITKAQVEANIAKQNADLANNQNAGLLEKVATYEEALAKIPADFAKVIRDTVAVAKSKVDLAVVKNGGKDSESLFNAYRQGSLDHKSAPAKPTDEKKSDDDNKDKKGDKAA